MKTIFKHSYKDTFLILQTILAIAVAGAMAVTDLSIVWYLAIAPFHIMLIVFIQNSSLHHHTHWSTFNKRKLNELYELLLAAASGIKPQGYRYVHTVHHKHVNDFPINGRTKDVISVFEHGVDGKVENVWKFCFRNAKFVFVDPWRYVFYQSWQQERPKTPFMNFAQWRREQFAIVVFFLTILAINFVYGLWLLAIYAIADFVDFSWHYGEHYGAYHYRGDTTQDSVGIYSKWYNWLCFNAGYHQEHHHRPGVHWTKQPEITAILPPTRVTVNGMHITNVPWIKHFKLLFKSC
jgi:fatty acid desaturase